MRKMRIFTIMLAILLMITGCATATPPTSATAPPTEAAPPASPWAAAEQAAPDTPIVIVDMFGREVTLPANIETIAAAGQSARILTYAGVADMIVGVTEMDKHNDPHMPYTVVNAERFAGLAVIGSGGAGGGTTFVEELVVLAPDVIIGTFDQTELDNIAAQTGIPTIGIMMDGMFDQTFFDALELVGKVAGRTERSAYIIGLIQNWRDDLYQRTRDIPDAERPTVYAAAVSFRGPHGITGTFGDYAPFEAIGARNVVGEEGITGFANIDIEQIAVWDPDIIFLNVANVNIVEEEFAGNRAFFEGLSAVRNGRIYPQLPFNFNGNNQEIAIANTFYAATIMFPEQFADIDPIAKADEIFTVMLGEPFYDRLAEIGFVFERMTIGGTA